MIDGRFHFHKMTFFILNVYCVRCNVRALSIVFIIIIIFALSLSSFQFQFNFHIDTNKSIQHQMVKKKHGKRERHIEYNECHCPAKIKGNIPKKKSSEQLLPHFSIVRFDVADNFGSRHLSHAIFHVNNTNRFDVFVFGAEI